LLAAIEKLADSYPISSSDSPQQVLKYTFAIVIIRLQPAPPFSGQNISFVLGNSFDFRGIQDANVTFGPSNGATASITLPGVLFTGQYLSNNTRIVYRCFLNSRPFLRRREYITREGLQYNRVGSVAVTARTVNGSIPSELREPVLLKFLKNPAFYNSTNTECSHWDQSLDEGYGGWSTENCSLVEETTEEAVCECNHLGNFAITLVSKIH